RLLSMQAMLPRAEVMLGTVGPSLVHIRESQFILVPADQVGREVGVGTANVFLESMVQRELKAALQPLPPLILTLTQFGRPEVVEGVAQALVILDLLRQ